MSRRVLTLTLVLASVGLVPFGAPASALGLGFANPGDIVVERVGDGTNIRTSNATPVFLDEYFPYDGSVVGTIPMPTATVGQNARLTVSGTGATEGMLTLSEDGQFLTLAGYDAAPGVTSVATSSSITVNRVVGRVDIGGSVDTSTRITSLISGSAVRGAVTSDGTQMWVSGAANGVVTLPFGAAGGTSILASPSNTRSVSIFGGQLYGSSASSPFTNAFAVGVGKPTSAAQTATSMPGMPTTSASPNQFAFLTLGAGPGPDTLYVADDRNVNNGGGVQKWVLNGSTWTLAGTIVVDAAVGARGVAANNHLGVVTIFATTVDSGGENDLVRIIDSNVGGAPSGTVKVIAHSPFNTVFRGVAFPPGTTIGSSATPPAADFEYDGKSDVGVFRTSNSTFYAKRSDFVGSIAAPFGASGDLPIPADYDGDHSADIAVYRPAHSTFYAKTFGSNGGFATDFGTTGDVPIPADFDGDGRADIAVWRSSNSTFYVKNSSDGTTTSTNFGTSTDLPIPADYDGDGRADAAIFRASNTTFHIKRSSDGTVLSTGFGTTGDVPIPGDYDGDSKVDIAVYRPAGSTFFVRKSTDGTTARTSYGISGDRPVVGDYDGDGRTDVAVYRPASSIFFVRNSSDGTTTSTHYGTTGDQPLIIPAVIWNAFFAGS